jgi:hypothetical protein
MPEVHRWNEALKSTHLEFSEALTAPNGKTPMPFKFVLTMVISP